MEIMKVRSATDRILLYLELTAGPDGHTPALRGELQENWQP